MPVAVQGRRAPEKEDPMDTIIKGLTIANSVYGIVDAGNKKEALLLEKAEKAKQQKFENQAKLVGGGMKEDEAGNVVVDPLNPFTRAKMKESGGSFLANRVKELDIKKKEADQVGGENLPIDQKTIVNDLSRKNAMKLSIANQIDSVMGGWDQLSEDQKIARGGQLLKTLNSPEGADAIGAEEANRLGMKLQFKMGNLNPFNENPIQWGRDLSGFAEQARGTSESIKGAVNANQSIINKTMGRGSDGYFPIPKEETKIIDGVTYKKVPGGWQAM